MKKHLVFISGLVISAALAAQDVKMITILHSNDLHSRLTGFAPEAAYTPLSVNDDKTRSGFARIATIIRNEKSTNRSGTLVLDAGDFLMGTLFTPLEPDEGFQLRLMKKMGYDFMALGNHEYDYGPGQLARIIKTSADKGDIPVLLAGNAVISNDNPADDKLGELFAGGLLKHTAIVDKDGIRIGLFSILGKDADGVAPNAAPVTFAKQVKTANELVRQLRSEGCTFIICVSHSGINKNKKGEWEGEDFELARKVRGINIIIGGHSHSKLDKPIIVNNVPIVQTGEFGQNIGKAEFIVRGGLPEFSSYKLIPVDDAIPGDPGIESMISAEKAVAESRFLKPLGLSWNTPVAESAFMIEGNDVGNLIESNLGPLVADAIHYYVNSRSPKGTDLSMVAAGMLFDKIVPGIQSPPDLFRVMSLGSGSDGIPGYALSRLYVTGRELKNILEILQVAWKSSPDNYCYYSGIKVDYDPEKGLLKKISRIQVIGRDGKARDVDFSKKNLTLYSVTANSYMLQFIGIIKKSSFGLINVVPKDAGGKPVKDMKLAVIDMDETKTGLQEGKEWLALISYLSSMSDTNGNGIPDIDSRYSKAVKSFFPVKGK